METKQEGQTEMCAPIDIGGVGVIPLLPKAQDFRRYVLPNNYRRVADQLENINFASILMDGYPVEQQICLIDENMMFNGISTIQSVTPGSDKGKLYGAISDNYDTVLCAYTQPNYLTAMINRQKNVNNIGVGAGVLAGGVVADVGVSIFDNRPMTRKKFVKEFIPAFLSGAIAAVTIPAVIQSVSLEKALDDACSGVSNQTDNISGNHFRTALALRKQIAFQNSNVAVNLSLSLDAPQLAVLSLDNVHDIKEIEEIMANPLSAVEVSLAVEADYLHRNTSLSDAEIANEVAKHHFAMAAVIPLKVNRDLTVFPRYTSGSDPRNVYLDPEILGFDSTGMSKTQILNQLS